LKQIYTVAVVGDTPKKGEKIRYRVWGYYFKRSEATACVKGNWTDISELGYYRYGVITGLGEGPIAIGKKLAWYEFVWNRKTKPRKHDGIRVPELVEVRPIKAPKAYEHHFFGLG